MRRDRRNKVSILKKTYKKNSFGENINETTVVYENIWSSKEPLLGNEFFSAEKVNSKVEVKFNMQFINGVTNEMLVKDNTGVYEIISAINVKELNRELLIYAKKING